jgi:ribulose-5-phosphate 4-epimerase/fuculose-1-phosphate aldolase
MIGPKTLGETRKSPQIGWTYGQVLEHTKELPRCVGQEVTQAQRTEFISVLNAKSFINMRHSSEHVVIERKYKMSSGPNRHDILDPRAYEPEFERTDDLRTHRKVRLALAYRVFGKMGWGSLGDGHISARDPDRPDCFWLARYGVPFGDVSPDDLVLVGPDGTVIEGSGYINMAAYFIHGPIHEGRPEIVSAAHCHTPYGTPFSALATRLQPISQESCAFFEDHEIFQDDEVSIGSTDGGKRIAVALGTSRAVVLRNHGLLTVGLTIDAAVGYFLLMERSAEVQLKAQYAADPHVVGVVAARRTHDEYNEQAAWQSFQWAVRTGIRA